MVSGHRALLSVGFPFAPSKPYNLSGRAALEKNIAFLFKKQQQ
jgi:hypothetical protein